MRENSQSHRKKAMTYAKEELKGKKVIDLSPVPDPESPKEPTDSECPQIRNVTSEEFRNITTNSKSRQKKYEERLEDYYENKENSDLQNKYDALKQMQSDCRLNLKYRLKYVFKNNFGFPAKALQR